MPKRVPPKKRPGTPKYGKLYDPDPHGFIGAGLAGLGKQELSKRVKQHQALAAKAFKAAGGGTKQTLTPQDVSNVYRGQQYMQRAKAMTALETYTTIGKKKKKQRP